jgi:hypothetical protein
LTKRWRPFKLLFGVGVMQTPKYNRVLNMRKTILTQAAVVLPALLWSTTVTGATFPLPEWAPCKSQEQTLAFTCVTDDGRYIYETSGLSSHDGLGGRLDLNVGIGIGYELREATIRPSDGRRFNAWGLDVAEGAARYYQTGVEPAPPDSDPWSDEWDAWTAWARSGVTYSGFSIAGYRGQSLVGFTDVLHPGAFRLDLGWRDLDRLTLRLLYPENYQGAGAPFNGFEWLYGTVGPNEAWCHQSCGISVAGLDIAPIPIPPAAALLLGGLAALGFMGWRRS